MPKRLGTEFPVKLGDYVGWDNGWGIVQRCNVVEVSEQFKSVRLHHPYMAATPWVSIAELTDAADSTEFPFVVGQVVGHADMRAEITRLYPWRNAVEIRYIGPMDIREEVGIQDLTDAPPLSDHLQQLGAELGAFLMDPQSIFEEGK